MLLGEALKIATTVLKSSYNPTKPGSELQIAHDTLQFAVDGNLDELIEQAVTILSSIPKEGTQELAIALTQIVEGGE